MSYICELYIFSQTTYFFLENYRFIGSNCSRLTLFGRIGNYLNKELLWFAYTGPLAVVTPTGSYFPSPLLEAFLEGVVLWILLNKVYSSDFPGKLSALFLIYYGIFRCGVELFIRTPDTQIGYYFWFLTQGFLLSFPMIVLWGGLYYFLKRKYASI